MRDKEIVGLYEAYMQVHQPQEEVEQLNEEAPERITKRTKNKRLVPNAGPARLHNPNKVDEEVEAWVNALVEEGYDLSEYTWDDMCEMYLDEARRADREGYERGTAANPTRAQTDVPHSDPSQRTSLHSKFRRRSDEMGRARRNSPRNRSGGRTPVSAKEKAFLQAGDRTSPGRGHVRSPNVGDTGRHSGEGRYDREDKKNPKLNPKHSANRENAAESFDLFDTILEYLVAEGYADTNETALVIMANMSEEWRQDIMEISQQKATDAYATSSTGEFEGADSPRDVERTNRLRKHIVRKFGAEAGEHADAAADARTFGRRDASGRRKQSPEPRIQTSDHRTTQDGKMHKQDQRELKTNLRIKRDRRLRAAEDN